MSDEDREDGVQSEETQENVEDNTSEKNELDPKSLLAQKKHWKEKAEKIQKELEALKEGQPKEQKTEEKAPEPSHNPDDIKEWVRATTQGYSDEEIELARKLKPGSILDALKDDTVQAAISGIRSKKKSEDAIPEPSRKVVTVGDKAFHDLSHDEKKANYASAVEKAIEKARKTQRTLS